MENADIILASLTDLEARNREPGREIAQLALETVVKYLQVHTKLEVAGISSQFMAGSMLESHDVRAQTQIFKGITFRFGDQFMITISPSKMINISGPTHGGDNFLFYKTDMDTRFPNHKFSHLVISAESGEMDAVITPNVKKRFVDMFTLTNQYYDQWLEILENTVGLPPEAPFERIREIRYTSQ